MRSRVTAFGCAALTALALTACGAPGDNAQDAAPDTPTNTSGSGIGDPALAFDNGVIGAKPAADAEGGSDTTTITGTLRNSTGDIVEVKGFTTTLGSQPTCTIVDATTGAAQEVEDGLVIPGHSTIELALDGTYFEISGYEPEITAGSTLDITIEIGSQQKTVITDVPVREDSDAPSASSTSSATATANS